MSKKISLVRIRETLNDLENSADRVIVHLNAFRRNFDNDSFKFSSVSSVSIISVPSFQPLPKSRDSHVRIRC